MEKYYLCRRININDKIIRDLKSKVKGLKPKGLGNPFNP